MRRLPMNITGVAAVAVFLALPARAQNADEILQKMRATYGALKSYSDTGVVLCEYSSSSEDRHTVSTYFNRAPRRFVLDFRKQGGARYVVGGDPLALHNWWHTTGHATESPHPNHA